MITSVAMTGHRRTSSRAPSAPRWARRRRPRHLHALDGTAALDRAAARRRPAPNRRPRCPWQRLVHRRACAARGNIRAAAGHGVGIIHSQPRGHDWQRLIPLDADAERSYAHLAQAVTSKPLLGMTLAGLDHAWSARTWAGDSALTWAESARVDAGQLRVSWNNDLRPAPRPQDSQQRTISTLGHKLQADLTRLRILVVGVGSIGLDIPVRLAATGVQHLAVMDPDIVKRLNLDRLIGAAREDADLHRPKVDVATRLMRNASTAEHPDIVKYRLSVCDPAAHAIALDYDVIFSCVDRPWPRAVLNALAYADLIPVIDGGIAIDAFADGTGMRNAAWRSHVLRPGRPCLVCNQQLDPATIQLDRQGLLDDPHYIAGARPEARLGHENVALLSAGASASMLGQFVSHIAVPGGQSEPGPLRYSPSTRRPHTLEDLSHRTSLRCHLLMDHLS